MSMPILTDELARSLERAVVLTKLREGGLAVARFRRAVALRSADEPWRDGVFRFGSADVGRLAEVLAGYPAAARPPFHLTPVDARADVMRALADAGYAAAAFRQAVLYGLPMSAAAAPPPRVTIEPVAADTVDALVSVVLDGFDYPPQWRAATEVRARHRFGVTGAHLYLARVDGEPAGSGGLTVGCNGFATLGWGAVVPRFRGRGVHMALIAHRSAVARAAGVRIVVGAAEFGSTSFRNQQRAGLRLGYLSTTWRPRVQQGAITSAV